MFEFLRRKNIPSDLSQIKTEHIPLLVKRDGAQNTGAILRRAAEAGSVDAAVALSTFINQGIEKGGELATPAFVEEFVRFTEMAARAGDNGSRFNLARYYNKLSRMDEGNLSPEGYEYLKKAEFWHKKAAAEGFAPSMEALQRLAPVYKWAHNTFAEV